MRKVEFKKGINVANELCAWAQLDGQLFMGIDNSQLLTDRDFEVFKEWKLDHIRVMIDFTTLMESAAPYSWKEGGWQKVAETIEMARKHEIGVVLDLHSTLGMEFQEGGSANGVRNDLLNNQEHQDLLCRIWKEFCVRCAGTEDFVAFEILNEVTSDDAVGWNTVALRVIALIRSYSKERTVIYGGVHWNAVTSLKYLVILENDPNIIYNFHFYKPSIFTHQVLQQDFRCALQNNMTGGMRWRYPGSYPGLELYEVEGNPPRKNGVRYIDRQVIQQDYLGTLYEFRKEHPELTIYCGEFGVNQYVHGESRYNWQRDVIEAFRENNVHMCYFMYKWPAWGILNPYDFTRYDRKLIQLLNGEV